ncbi:MAG: peptide-methionine (S)-S-oxide reductase MsrA [Methanolobus sp.]|nr:peptide-methionine (S)-S-oxide reductase MsrA [Methanolobus sp.]
MESKEELLNEGYETATFAAGCFWGVESTFRKVKGVGFTQVGYTGGTTENPTYKRVCTGTTGHAEAVEVVFNPSVVSYEKLLELFWALHDPTTLNRQGPDVGTQYRSAIFYHNAEQRDIAIASKMHLEKSREYNGEIVTQILPAGLFYRAEEYHQQYFEKMGTDGGCVINH